MTRLRIAFLVLYVLLIFAVSSRPYLNPPGPEFANKDKLAHFAEYSILGILLFWGVGFTVSRSKVTTFAFLFAVGVSVAALDELFQGYIPGRMTDIHDWLADAGGVAAALGVLIATSTGRRRVPAGNGGQLS